MLLDVQFVTLASVFANLSSHRSYFIVDTDGTNPPLLVMTSSGGGGFSFVYTGDGASFSFHGNTFSYLYSSNSGSFSGYFDTNSVTHLQINGPIIGLTALPETLTSLELTSNVDWDISYLTNLQTLKLNLFDSTISQPFLNELNLTNLSNLSQVEIHNSQLNTFNADGLNSLVNLNLSNNSNLSEISNRNSSAVVNLNIANCSFSDVSQFHFGSLVNLNISGMTFSKFDIADFDNNHLYDFEMLETLTAIDCSMTFFSPTASWEKESSQRSSALTNIDLSQNDFSSLGIDISLFPLYDCSLISCNLDENNSTFSPSTSILDISNNNFTDVNLVNFNLSILIELYLNNNNSLLTISEINQGIQKIVANDCSSLIDLNLLNIYTLVHLEFQRTSLSSNEQIGYNFLSQMVDSGPSNLNYLNFSGSPINATASILEKIFEIANLTTVDFSDCAQNVGEGLKGSISLDLPSSTNFIDFSNNSLTEFTVKSSLAENLEYLNISNNSISIFNLGFSYINYPNLHTLNVSYNQITNWTESTTHTDNLSYFPSLQNLIIRNNLFEFFNLYTGIESSTINNLDFSDCSNLQYVNLGGSNYNDRLLPINNITLNSVGLILTFNLQNLSNISGLTVSNSTWSNNILEIDTTNTVNNLHINILSVVGIETISTSLEVKSLSIVESNIENISVNTNIMNYFKLQDNLSIGAELDLSIGSILSNLTALSGNFILNNNFSSCDQDIYLVGLPFLSNLEDIKLGVKPSNLDSITSFGFLASDNNYNYLGILKRESYRFLIYNFLTETLDSIFVGTPGDDLTDIMYDPYNEYFWIVNSGTQQIAIFETNGAKVKDIGIERAEKIVFNEKENKVYGTGGRIFCSDLTDPTFATTIIGNGYMIDTSEIEYDAYNGTAWVCGNLDRIEIYKDAATFSVIDGSTLGISNPLYMTFNTLYNQMYVTCDEGIAIIDCVSESPSYLTVLDTINLSNARKLKYDKSQNAVVCQSGTYFYIIDCETKRFGYRSSLTTNNIVGITYDQFAKKMIYSFDEQSGDFDGMTFELGIQRDQYALDITSLESIISNGWTVELDDYPNSDDSDVQNFLTRNNSNGPRQVWAIKSFVRNLKGLGSPSNITTNRKNIWSKLDIVYPFLPINQTTTVDTVAGPYNNYSYNLISSGFTISWASASQIDFTNLGILLNDDTYGDTNFNPNVEWVGTSHSFGVLINNISDYTPIGASDVITQTEIRFELALSTVSYALSSILAGFTLPITPIILTVNRSNDQLELYLDSTLYNTTTNVFISNTNQNLYLLSNNNNGSPNLFYREQVKGYFIGDYLTDLEINDLNESWSYYNSLIGR